MTSYPRINRHPQDQSLWLPHPPRHQLLSAPASPGPRRCTARGEALQVARHGAIEAKNRVGCLTGSSRGVRESRAAAGIVQ